MTKKLVITKNVIHRNVYYTKGEEHFLSDRDADAITSVGCGEEYTPPDIEDNTIEGRANAEVSLGVTFSGTWDDPFALKISPTNCKVKGFTDGSEIASGTNKTINGTITEHNKELAKLKAVVGDANGSVKYEFLSSSATTTVNKQEEMQSDDEADESSVNTQSVDTVEGISLNSLLDQEPSLAKAPATNKRKTKTKA